MTLYQVSEEWEYNGRDDSDWFVVCYNTETDKLDRVQVGTTRFPFCTEANHGIEHGSYSSICYKCAGIVGKASEEILCKAEIKLAEILVGLIKSADRTRLTRGIDIVGTRVRLAKDINNRPRELFKDKCPNCNGDGLWVNPKNVNDKRKCFKCNGTAKIVKSKSVKGKLVVIAAGTKAVVLNAKTYGGYSKWSKSTSVILKDDLGNTFRAPKESLMLDKDPLSDNECIERAKEYAKQRNFYSSFATAGISLV